ncbi:3-hydroxy-9,10-secoandrosta-1,3,5(10)-triene-9,17-dione monooxygenase [Micromonospora profundi]|uniref:acyl-CoA dehydrogenase family protein n=1 Tax=Micromonospora profundi TaxID=1420889 RepID=UPI0014391C03|nr:acyl-CoA dehydrogenase family protein [Micromonospora profundi]NJC11485.1 3-hydroxy-9,10-secoandrosta-1,3,5(10)-triene-9,17-dione monooxygenase [Micromonospora profundi]
MTANTDTVERHASASSEAGITGDQMIARAEAMVDELIERQAETEARGFYAEDTHERFARNGFYRILVPRRYGGYELGIDTFFRVCVTLARGCGSTGWMFGLGTSHGQVAASIFGERAQEEMFAGGDFICPGTAIPRGTAVPAAGGGWTVNGTWSYCSGSPYGTHFMGHSMLPAEDGKPPTQLLFVAPRSQWKRLDDWGQQLGMRGSGSHGITMENVHIPPHMGLPGVQLVQYDATAGTPGRTLHGNPEYGGGPLAFINFLNCSIMVGMARGALDAYEHLLRERTTLVPPVVPRYLDPDYQVWYGEAVGMIGTAEAALMNAVQQWHDAAVRGPSAVTPELDLRLSAISRHVATTAWTAVEGIILPTAGSSAIRHGERLERVWRDLSTLRTHAGLSILLPTIAMRELAKSVVR